MEFLLAAHPERSPVIEVEADARAVFPGRAGYLEAEAARVRAERRDEAGHMYYLYALFSEYAVEVEVLDIERPADFAGTVVPDPGAAGAAAAVCDVDLVPVAPGASLRHFGAFKVHSA